VKWAFPPDYQYQVPLFFTLINDTTANITHVEIQDDTYKPNKVIEFTIASLNESNGALIHFSIWVLVKNHEFEDLPSYVKIPKKRDLPEITQTWLASTKVVQTRNIILKLKARQLRPLGKNLIRFTDKVASFIKDHRYGLFLIQLKLNLFLSQDALTTLLIGGENVGRSHLACALLRASNIPARVLLAHNDQGFWTQMHYMVEYYVPDYGWVLLDSTKGETPYATKRQIINRVCHPDDEQDTKWDYILPRMRGEERWLWIDNDQVTPWYEDCNAGSKSQMFTEGSITTTDETVNHAFVLSKTVFSLYQKYLGGNLSGVNLSYFENATYYQEKAIEEFTNWDIIDYIIYMDKAYDEYMKINYY